jgi:hypothetical protein
MQTYLPTCIPCIHGEYISRKIRLGDIFVVIHSEQLSLVGGHTALARAHSQSAGHAVQANLRLCKQRSATPMLTHIRCIPCAGRCQWQSSVSWGSLRIAQELRLPRVAYPQDATIGACSPDSASSSWTSLLLTNTMQTSSPPSVITPDSC